MHFEGAQTMPTRATPSSSRKMITADLYVRIQPLRPLLVALYVLASLALTAFSTRSALETTGRPFSEVLPFHNLYVGAFTQRTWKAKELGLAFHDRILSAQGRPIETADEWNQAILEAQGNKENTIRATIDRKGKTIDAEFPIRPLSASEVFNIFFPLIMTGVAFFAIGAFVLLITPSPKGAFPFAIYCAAAGTYFLTAYDFHTTFYSGKLLLVAFALMPASVIHFGALFPTSIKTAGLGKHWEIWPYVGAFFLGVPYYSYFDVHPKGWITSEYLLFTYLSAAYVWWTLRMIRLARTEVDPEARAQARLILIPLLPAFGLIFIATWLVFILGVPLALNWVVPASAVFPGAIAYGILRRNLFLVDRLETEVAERTLQLRKAQVELVESKKLAAVGTLAAGTAHEIGNAMNLIGSNLPVLRTYAQNLLKLVETAESSEEFEKKKQEFDFSYLKNDLPELLSNLQAGSDRAIGIVRDLRLFARPNKARDEVIDLRSLVDSTLRLLKPKLESRITLTWKPTSSIETTGSVGEIQQVLVNVLLNAIESIDKAGDVTVTLLEETPWIVLSIKDSGKGLTPEELQHVFEPFFSTKSGGTGLGLSVSYGIAQAHGGKITISSEKTKGTDVRIYLPKRKAT